MRYNRLYKENNFLTPTTDTQTLSEYVEGLCYENLPREAVERAKEYISGALAAMLDLGKGSGPLDHGYGFRQISGC